MVCVFWRISVHCLPPCRIIACAGMYELSTTQPEFNCEVEELKKVATQINPKREMTKLVMVGGWQLPSSSFWDLAICILRTSNANPPD